MIKIYKLFSNILKLIINVTFVLQIVLMVTVFLTGTYCFLNLINISAFDFVKPLADVISEFIRGFYTRDVNAGGVYIDASLLLFDVLAVGVVIVLAKAKYYLLRGIDTLKIEINKTKKAQEDKFNKSLQKEVDNRIKKSNKVAVLIELTAKSMLIDDCWGGDKEAGVKEKEDEAFKIFYSSIKNIAGCKFAKTDNEMLILMDNFDEIDNLLTYINLIVNRIKTNMKKRKWLFISHIAVDVYDEKTNFKTDVYPILEKLINLHIQNEPVCLSNFCMRYELLSSPAFRPFLRGSYAIIQDDNSDVWSLIKKD